MEHLNDPTVRVVEVDVSPEPYKDAHIPGAVFWFFKTFGHDRVYVLDGGHQKWLAASRPLASLSNFAPTQCQGEIR